MPHVYCSCTAARLLLLYRCPPTALLPTHCRLVMLPTYRDLVLLLSYCRLVLLPTYRTIVLLPTYCTRVLLLPTRLTRVVASLASPRALVMDLVRGQPMAAKPTSQHLLRCK